jgi:ATP-dependent Zn protease
MSNGASPNGTGHSSEGPNANGTGGAVGLDEALPILPAHSAPQVTLAKRARANWWVRLRLILLAVALWWVLFWAALVNNPILSFKACFDQEVHSLLWLEILGALEVLRQLSYFAAERSARWNRFVTDAVFGPFNRAIGRISDWNRYRIGRVFRVVIVLVVLALILAAYFHTSPVISLFQVPAALFTALPFILQLAFAFFFVVFQFVGLFWFLGKGGIDTYFPGDVKTRFSDVWGQDNVVNRIKENIIFLQNPEAIESRGGYVPGGILLWGPPGTGKTLIAEAVAGETQSPFVFVDPGAFNSMFMGIGVLKVKSLFRKLRRLAVRFGGVVVFFDEADSLGNRGALSPGGIFGGRMSPTEQFELHHGCNGFNYLDGSTQQHMLRWSLANHASEEAPATRRHGMMGGMMSGGSGTGTLQSLLAEMSGLKKPRGFLNRFVRRALGFQPKPPPKYRILVMMATNMPNSLDDAMLRPGRIDRIYKVGYPSKAGRIRTYEGYLSKVAHNLTPEQIERLATVTPYATGATIKDIVNEALINTIREEREFITWRDIVKAKQLKELGPPEDVEYIERERHAVAVHEACHAVSAVKVRQSLVIDVATIEKGGSYLGMVSNVRVEDTFTRWRSDFEADIMVSLASLAGERMFFDGDNSSGVSGDLETATAIATYMEGYWGMGRTVASHGVTREAGVPGGGGGRPDDRERRRSERSAFEVSLGGRIEAKLNELMDKVTELLAEHRLEVLAVAHALETHKTITGEDVIAIINGEQGPLIDGRAYHTEEFRQMAEAYHAQVLAAHKLHGRVDGELPRLPDLSDLVALEPANAPSTPA